MTWISMENEFEERRHVCRRVGDVVDLNAIRERIIGWMTLALSMTAFIPQRSLMYDLIKDISVRYSVGIAVAAVGIAVIWSSRQPECLLRTIGVGVCWVIWTTLILVALMEHTVGSPVFFALVVSAQSLNVLLTHVLTYTRKRKGGIA